MSPKSVKALTIGSSLMDLVIPANPALLNTLSGQLGGMETITEEQLQQYLLKSGSPIAETAGGSAANVAKCLSALGTKSAFFGKIGDDPSGMNFVEKLSELGVAPLCIKGNGSTGHVLCFIGEDASRTCRSFLGASLNLGPDDLKPELFEGIKLVHLEGYTLLKEGLAERAMQLAKQAGALLSFDLGSFEIVEQHRGALIYLLEHYVDILFGNEKEAQAMTLSNALSSCEYLKEICKIAVIFQGDKGCFIGKKGESAFHIPACKVHAVDTTGAGDLFAGGFLHAYLENKALAFCGQLGTLAAAEVVQVYGADLSSSAWSRINSFYHSG